MEHGGDRIDIPSRITPSQQVVEAIASAEGISPEELSPPEYEPLHSAIDAQALDSLFEPTRTGSQRGAGTVRFVYCGYDVTVHGDGSVSLGGTSEE